MPRATESRGGILANLVGGRRGVFVELVARDGRGGEGEEGKEEGEAFHCGRGRGQC